MARTLGEPEPDELYLLADVNAFAAWRGAFFGLACVAAALWIGWALVPRFSFKRPDRAEPLPETAHPRLRAFGR